MVYIVHTLIKNKNFGTTVLSDSAKHRYQDICPPISQIVLNCRSL